MTDSTIEDHSDRAVRHSEETIYNAAHQGAVLVDRSRLGMLKFTGKTRLDLLNRMSTQKLVNLKSGEGAATVLTTDIGRIIDRLIIYTSSEAVYCLTGENNAANVADYLRRFIFFMDDFHIEDLTSDTVVLGVYGAQAEQILSNFFGHPVDLPLHHWKSFSLHYETVEREAVDMKVYVHRTDPIAGGGYLVMTAVDDREPLWNKLLNAGLLPAGEEMFEYLRLESGLPRFGHELTGEYIPLETGLWDDVSFNKGCYTGQEIIARMESRGRLAKRLVLLKSEQVVEIGAYITSEGKKAGMVTSSADGPAGPLAMAYVKTSFLEEEAPLSAGSIDLSVVAP